MDIQINEALKRVNGHVKKGDFTGLMVMGDLNYDEIAKALQKSINTIYGYRDRVFKKLHVKQRTAMVMKALKQNHIDL